MSAFEMAKKYYPHLWPIERLGKLLAAGKLTRKEYDELTAPIPETEEVKENDG